MHTEKSFEKNTVVTSLTTNGGYLEGNPSDYDKSLALFSTDVIAFIKATQPELYDRIERGQKANTESYILKFLTNALASSGSLNVLRHGFNCYGKTIKMAYFAPNTSLNSSSKEHYDGNILKVTQQVHTEFNEIPDLILSVNGIPVVTIELKNQLSATRWNVEDAIIQYKQDRNPNGRLFAFKTRTLVHFAVDTDLVYMTTRLNGQDTYFLPFNRGHKGGAGNPPVEGNVRTHYLWEQVLAKDSLMDIIGRFIHLEVIEKKIKTETGYRHQQSETMIFPRYHQLDCVRKLTHHSREHGAGRNYLIQHSAGSGKSNSIAWLAHHLSSMHNEYDDKVFDATIVITDRVVLDRQLQDTITQFEHKAGVVQKIDEDSHQLAKAIASDTQIIITTIQKFPFVMDAVKKLRDEGSHLDLDTKGKKFAIIVDEAHSSQSGETATELRKVLNQDGIESAIAQEFLFDSNDDDDGLDAQAKAQLYRETHKRQRQPNLSFFAFTATPKWKTLALFDEPGDNGQSPFHTYTMRQAIEEGFIFDVLSNYTNYKQYFKLLKIAQDDKEVVKNQTKKQLLRFVSLHPSVINQKVEVIIEHFREVTMHKIGGRAKAMVVTESRESAIRYKIAFDDYIKEKGYSDIKSLVAFSGKLALSEAPAKEYTEVSLNNGIQEKELVDKFDTDEYQVLLVAEKYQTGFDQPLLHTMFVDKRLSGVQAVQTLSRLNRTTKGKEDTFVLDFVNTDQDIYDAFKPYYEVASLGDTPDELKLEGLVTDLDAWQVYFKKDINDFASVWFKDKRKLSGNEHKQLNSILDRSKERYEDISHGEDLEQQQEKKRLFKSQVQSYLNLYQFVSQIMPYADTSHERRYVYLRALLKVLPKGNTDSNVDISSDVALQFYRLQKIGEGSINLKDGDADDLKGSTDVGTGKPKSTDHISVMVQELNDAYGTDFTPADQLFFDQVIEEALKDETILQAMQSNSLESFTDFLSTKMMDLFLTRITGNEEVCNTVMSNGEIKSKVARRLAKQLYDKSHQ